MFDQRTYKRSSLFLRVDHVECKLRHFCIVFAGKNICALESCDKPCYVENDGHVHDYCGKGHAHDHRLRIESIWPGGYAHFPIHSICRPYHQETHRTHGYYLRSQSCKICTA